MIISILLCNVFKLQSINASCHHASCYVIFMNLTYDTYGVCRWGQECFVKIHGQKSIHYSHMVHEQTIICITIFQHMTSKWLHMKDWRLIYVFFQFSIVANCYFPCVSWYIKDFFNWKLLCMFKHNVFRNNNTLLICSAK